jgi:hypothetical protein
MGYRLLHVIYDEIFHKGVAFYQFKTHMISDGREQRPLIPRPPMNVKIPSSRRKARVRNHRGIKVVLQPATKFQ